MLKANSVHISDPVHGFINVPRDLLLPLLHTPHVQRLRRIRQLGTGFMVFPGADHSRFSHALGAMALMQETLDILADKGTPICDLEHKAATAAALLHDIGHAPFSHLLEYKLIEGASHETITGALIQSLVGDFGEPLELALQMFTGEYDRSFFHCLIASQLDMDRLDYLRRDSQYTGVIEGRIGVERILQTMCVYPTPGGKKSQAVVEWKGIYAVQKLLMARQMMYWQVYLHKAVVGGDQLALAAVRRARKWYAEGRLEAVEGTTPPLHFFLQRGLLPPSALEDPAVLAAFLQLDDTDILTSMKAWAHSPDKILADLSRRFIQRDLFSCRFLDKPPSSETHQAWLARMAEFLCTEGLSMPQDALDDAHYYLAVGEAVHTAYAKSEEPIRVLINDGPPQELSSAADALIIDALTHFVHKPYRMPPQKCDFEIGNSMPQFQGV